MLSIIISSYRPNLFSQLKENIEKTCGVSYEIIRIDNPGKYSINTAYNLGIDQSAFNILVFCHEDILFESIGWGKVVEDLLHSYQHIGLIGVAGSKLKTKAPSAWGEGGDHHNEIFINEYDGEKKTKDTLQIQKKRDFVEVAILDGVFLAMRKSDSLRFDENLEGFHNYDQAISVRYHLAGLSAIVSFKIILSHYSAGNFDKSWLESTHEFHKLYHKNLPISVTGEMPDVAREKKNYVLFFNKSIHQKQFKVATYYLIQIWKRWFYTFTPYFLFGKLMLTKRRA